MNLIHTQSDIFITPDNINTIERAYYLFAGYRFPINEAVSIEPATLIKLTEAAAWQADVMVKGTYNQYWAGLSYRTGDAVSALLGMRIDMFSFSYSYDYPVSEIGNFNRGTHEVTAAVHIFNDFKRRTIGEGGGTRGKSFNQRPKRRR